MKRKILQLLMLALVSFTSRTFAQNCTTDPTNTKTGATPSPIPTACENKPYDETIQLLMNSDTIVNGADYGYPILDKIPVTIKKVEVISVTNQAAGLDYDCENNDCIINEQDGFLRSCIVFQGTPTIAGKGTSNLELKVYISYVSDFYSFDTSYTHNYDIEYEIKPQAQCDELSSKESSKQDVKITPNPITQKSVLTFTSRGGNTKIEIYDLLGTKVKSINAGVLHSGIQNVSMQETSSLTSGIYLVKIIEGGQEVSEIQKIIIR